MSTRELSSSRPAADPLARARVFRALPTLMTKGPAICPMAKADVKAAISLVGEPTAMRRASWAPAMVMTMNVPPTHRDETTSEKTLI